MSSFSWASVPRPIMAMAPMEGYTDSPFRQLVKELSPNAVCFTEFTSSDALVHGNDYSRQKVSFVPGEQPLIVQIFGKNPESFEYAAKYIEDSGAAGVDINMGCPAKRVVNSGHGSALLKCPEKVMEIIERTAKATKLPVSVKMRLGWSDASTLIALAQQAESAGAQLITIHGRTYQQAFRGEANWDPIYEMKRHVSIPVIGNGDVASVADGMRRLRNLDGFMVGRAMIGNPWLFRYQERSEFESMPLSEKLPVIKRHLQLMCEMKGERSILELRKHLASYVKGMEHAAQIRSSLVRVESFEQAHALLAAV